MINDLKFVYLGRNLSSSPKTIQDNRLGENFCLAYLSIFILYLFVCHYYTFEWKNTSSTHIISLKFYADFTRSEESFYDLIRAHFNSNLWHAPSLLLWLRFLCIKTMMTQIIKFTHYLYASLINYFLWLSTTVRIHGEYSARPSNWFNGKTLTEFVMWNAFG